jgi:hypothetical protein
MRSMVEGARGGDAFCRPPAQKLTVIPDCHEVASPQSIVTISEYGFRARPLGSPGMTAGRRAMSESSWTLHAQLAADTTAVGELALSRVLAVNAADIRG